MFTLSPKIITANAILTLSSFAFANGTTYPTGWVATLNQANWALNLATQAAGVPLVTIPLDWQYTAAMQTTWVSGAFALTTTLLTTTLRNAEAGGTATAIMHNSLLTAANAVTNNAAGPGGDSATYGVNNAGTRITQLCVRTVNTDANTITATQVLYIRAFKAV